MIYLIKIQSMCERVVLASDACLLELLKYVMTRHMSSCVYAHLQMIGGKVGSHG